MSQHLSAFRVVPHCPCDPHRAGLPYPPEGIGQCRQILQWHCLPTYSAQRGYSRRENIWPHHGMGTSLTGEGFYHRGGNEATRPAYPLWAQLALCPGVTQWGCPPHVPPYWGSPECHDGGKHQQHFLWDNLPIGSPPASELRLPGGLSRRHQWVSNPCNNIPAWVVVQWCNHAGR